MHRQELAKVLWKHSSEPIPLALICCRMYKKLAPYCYEPYQRSLIEKSAKEFSDYAVGVLDKAFSDDDARACDMLDERHPVKHLKNDERERKKPNHLELELYNYN